MPYIDATDVDQSFKALVEAAIDITAPHVLQVEYDARRKVLYVHVNGMTLLRVCRIADKDAKQLEDQWTQKASRSLKSVTSR